MALGRGRNGNNERIRNDVTERERNGITRRKFLITGNALVAGTLAAMVAIPLGGYLGGAIGIIQPVVRVRLGPLASFPIGVPTAVRFAVPISGAGITYRRPVTAYVVRTGSTYFVFYNGCTHMGCPVRWDQISGQFMCPCHGGVYAMTGQVVHGPPPYALRQFRHELIGGDLYVYDDILD